MHGPMREAVARVREDRERGSEAVSQDALEALARHVDDAPAKTPDELRDSTREAARELARARPAMRVVASKVAAAWRRVDNVDATGLAGFRAAAREAVEGLAGEAAQARVRAAETAREILADAHPVVTLSRSSTVLRALEGAPGRVHVLESRPGGEGRGFAADLREAGVDADLAPDAHAAGLLADATEAAVVLGADGITREGAVVNKVGSRTLAAAARQAGAPVWVVSSTWKCAPRAGDAEAAVWDPEGVPGVAVPLMEEVPADLVAGIASDDGPLRPREAAEVARERAGDLAALVGSPA